MSQSSAARGGAHTSLPMADLLARELARARIRDAGPPPKRLDQFARWYLQAVQLLSAHVAQGSAQASMTRDEVELMCRAAMSSTDMAEAIALCARFCAMLHPRAGRLTLVVHGDQASLRLDSLREATTATSSLVDITGLFAFRQLLQWLMGRPLPLRQVGIGPIEREDVLPFLKLFGAPVLAGGELCALDFDAEALGWPTVRSAAEFADFFELFPCAVFDVQGSELADQVEALMHSSLRRGEGVPDQHTLAEILGMPVSTLRRRLRQLGPGYRRLKERCQREEALVLLRRGDLQVAQVAQRLGFSDTGSFRRAFRQWFECSPTDWLRERDRRPRMGTTTATGEYPGDH